MAIIINKSEFTISVNPVDGPAFIIPPNGSNNRLNDKQAREWADRPHNSFIRVGYVVVRYDAVQRSAASQPVEPDAPITTIDGMHWRKVAAALETIDDLDLLADLHASEKRPKIREAIEARMTEIQDGSTARDAV